MAIYFYYGDEEYLIEEELQKFRNKLDKNFSTMNYKSYTNPKYTDLVSILRTQPMMFGDLMIVINSNDLLTNTYEDNQIDELSAIFNNNNDNVNIFFVAKYPRNEGKKPDSRRKLFKLLSKFNIKEFPSISINNVSELSNFINKEAKKYNITIEKKAITTLIDHIGNNLREYNMELEKLSLLAFPNKTITSEMINNICISNQYIFAFTDYLMKQQNGKSLIEFRKLLDKKHPLEILATTQTMLRKWILIKLNSGNMSNKEIASLVGLTEYRVKDTIQKLNNISLKELIVLKEHFLEAEFNIKSGASVDPVMEVENAIIR